MTNVPTLDMRRAAAWSLALSVLLIVAGALAIAIPVIAGFAVTGVLAWLLIVTGVLHLALALNGGALSAVIWEILLGAVYGAIGIYVLVHPVAGLESLTLAIAAYLFVKAVLEFFLSFELRHMSGVGWLVLDAAVTLILAVLIASTWPSSAAWVIGTFVGVSMLFSGITRFMVSRAIRRLVA
jgi:uncharacterized membrane protein HdeD (DUF308 family)